MENKVNYIIDGNANKTHVVIPMDLWGKIKHHVDLEEDGQIVSWPKKHMYNLMNFVKETNDLPVDKWKQAYEKFYNYYETLKLEDILALYLFRSNIWSEPQKEDLSATVTYWKTFHTYEVSSLLEKTGKVITVKTLRKIRNQISELDEQDFIKLYNKELYLHEDFITEYKSKYQRLRRSTERDRLFIYDLGEAFALSNGELNKEYRDLFTQDDDLIPGDLKGKVYEYIANRLYNGNISQVYRAAKEASDRMKEIQYI